MSKWIAALIAGVLSAYAAAVVAQFGTPIDSALPLIAVMITVLAAISHPAIQLAVPLLIGGEIAIADERVRLMWFGVVLGVTFGAAVLGPRSSVLGRSPAAGLGPRASGLGETVLGPRSSVLGGSAVLTVFAILLLRWIPFSNVIVWRELVLMAIALLIVLAMRGTPFGIAVAVAAALFTPLIPLRTIVPAFIVLAAAVVAWWLGLPELRLRVFSATALANMLTFFAWSGVLARAPQLAIRGLPASTSRSPVRMALAPGQSLQLDLPQDATGLILSGANMARLRPGTVVGSVNGTQLRIGDIADWGFLRREHFYKSTNRVPRNPAGELRDYGQTAWVDGAARYEFRGPRTEDRGQVTVRADKTLPTSARLQIDAFELGKR